MLTINNTLDGYLKDVEILGNTIQNEEDLADIRSVGDKVEGQELYEIPVLCTNGLDSKNSEYQEDKLTILSPVQLEKVGDVADRIICKDEVWGVEKNISRELIDTKDSWIQLILDDVIMFGTSSKYKIPEWFGISNYFIYENSDSNNEHFKYDINTSKIYTYIKKSKLSTQDVAGFEKWSTENGYYHIFPTTQPQFIPLPHSQQVKLRTFAGKTNISFGCEIEGTIKAQVPKSLGATVNTHTEQINNLNKELDRVKKLEESTVSTVTTESDFTTVEATSNGYFEDVRLEGKTLVNLVCKPTGLKEDGDYYYLTFSSNTSTLGNHTYIINNYAGKQLTFITNKPSDIVLLTETGWKGALCYKSTCSTHLIPDDVFSIGFRVLKTEITNVDEMTLLVLEGDHTQNPPSYFEGLKSVGQSASEDGVDEIVVSSVNENLCPVTNDVVNTQEILWYEWGGIKNAVTPIISKSKYKFYLGKGTYKILWDSLENVNSQQIITFDGVKVIASVNNESIFTVTNGTECVLRFRNVEANKPSSITNCRIIRENTNPHYTPHQSDKKRLLYYNNETQTWEKPILREWDSIEKHANGKYYYHQRSGEVVLHNHNRFVVRDSTKLNTLVVGVQDVVTTKGVEKNLFCNRFNWVNNALYIEDNECILAMNSGEIRIYVSKSKLSTQDIAGFKAWLQANPTTVVYQLAEEKVYECTNIDLITYANETNYLVESGVLSPKTTLKVHNNISNVVSLLQKKVSLLESNMTKYMITQNRLQLSSTHSADSVTFKVDYTVCSENMSQENYDTDLYNLILNNILVGKDNYDYDHMFNIIMDYASWSQISWDQFDILVGLMDIQHNPPIEEMPTDDEIVEETPNEIM